MEQIRLEHEQRREEREHELKIFRLLLGNQVAQPIAVPPVAYAQQTIRNTSFCSKVTTVMMKKELISSCETTDIPIVPILTFIF